MKTKLTVRFASGREERFEVDLFGGASSELRLKEFVKDPTLVLQTADELIIIPATSIESISLSLPALGQERLGLKNVRKAKRMK